MLGESGVEVESPSEAQGCGKISTKQERFAPTGLHMVGRNLDSLISSPCVLGPPTMRQTLPTTILGTETLRADPPRPPSSPYLSQPLIASSEHCFFTPRADGLHCKSSPSCLSAALSDLQFSRPRRSVRDLFDYANQMANSLRTNDVVINFRLRSFYFRRCIWSQLPQRSCGTMNTSTTSSIQHASGTMYSS